MTLNAVLNSETGKLEEYRTLLKGVDKILWERANSKEVARLAQGRKDGSVKGTETLHFIAADQLPKGKIPTYLRICANHRPQKADPFRRRRSHQRRRFGRTDSIRPENRHPGHNNSDGHRGFSW